MVNRGAWVNDWDSNELEEGGFDVWKNTKPEKQSKKQKEPEDEEFIEKLDFFNLMLGDRIYDSNNEFDIHRRSDFRNDGSREDRPSDSLYPATRWYRPGCLSFRK